MAGIKVKPVEYRVQVQSIMPSRNEISKKAKRCLFGCPQPGETQELFEKDQENNFRRLHNYQLVNPKNRVDFFPDPGNNEDQIKTIKRPGSPRITDHFKLVKKVCKASRPTPVTSKEKLSDVDQCTPEASKIGSTNFVTNIVTSDSTLEADTICTDELLPPTHQQILEQSQEEVTLHIIVTDHAGKFS